MTDATPRTAAETYRHATRYEVVAEGPGARRMIVGFTPRTTRRGLIALLQSRGAEILDLVRDVPEDEPMAFARDGAGRWTASLGPWTFRFTGRTENTARQEG